MKMFKRKKKYDISNYKPYKGFFDLRDFDLTKEEFISFWQAQSFLYDVNKRMDIYKKSFQWEQIKEFAARYQVKLLEKESKQGRLL